MYTSNDYETDYIKIYIPSYNKKLNSYHNNINNNNNKLNIDQIVNSIHSRFPYRISLKEPHVLDSPIRKVKIRGYSGFLPNTKNIVGIPIIPNEDKQLLTDIDIIDDNNYNNHDVSIKNRNHHDTLQYKELSLSSLSQTQQQQKQQQQQQQQQLKLHKEIDLIERYNRSVQSCLLSKGQTQVQLLKIVQSKISESDFNYAQLLIRIKKLIEAFDYQREGVMNEGMLKG